MFYIQDLKTGEKRPATRAEVEAKGGVWTEPTKPAGSKYDEDGNVNSKENNDGA